MDISRGWMSAHLKANLSPSEISQVDGFPEKAGSAQSRDVGKERLEAIGCRRGYSSFGEEGVQANAV